MHLCWGVFERRMTSPGSLCPFGFASTRHTNTPPSAEGLFRRRNSLCDQENKIFFFFYRQIASGLTLHTKTDKICLPGHLCVFGPELKIHIWCKHSVPPSHPDLSFLPPSVCQPADASLIKKKRKKRASVAFITDIIWAWNSTDSPKNLNVHVWFYNPKETSLRANFPPNTRWQAFLSNSRNRKRISSLHHQRFSAKKTQKNKTERRSLKEEAWNPFWGTFNQLFSCFSVFCFREKKTIREIPFNTRADPEAADITNVEERITESWFISSHQAHTHTHTHIQNRLM